MSVYNEREVNDLRRWNFATILVAKFLPTNNF